MTFVRRLAVSLPRAGLASMAALGVCTLAGGPLHAADPPITEEARTHFAAGVNLLRDPDGARYEEAYREFKAAYASSPSYKILGNLGLCAMKLERDGEAVDAYTNYLARASDLDPAEAKQVATDLQTLRAGVVKLTITVEPGGAMLNDVRVPVRGERVVNQYGPINGPIQIGVRAGHHVMTLKLAGMEDATWEFDAPAGAVDSKRFSLHKPTAASPSVAAKDTAPSESRPVPSGVYIGLAATGALAIGGGITGLMAIGKRNDFNAKNDGSNPSAASQLRDQGGTLNLVTDILFGGALVAVGVTSVVYFSRPSASSASIELPRVAVGKDGTTVSVRGAF
jgi:hypothetical protein